MKLGPAGFLIHRIHAFIIYVTAFILLKGFLYAQNSQLIRDKANLNFRFPYDGPGRGGTCDISAPDAFIWSFSLSNFFYFFNFLT